MGRIGYHLLFPPGSSAGARISVKDTCLTAWSACRAVRQLYTLQPYNPSALRQKMRSAIL